MNKTRYPFCWWCSRKLWGNKFATITVDGHDVTVHKDCAAEYEAGRDARLFLPVEKMEPYRDKPETAEDKARRVNCARIDRGKHGLPSH